MLPNPAAELAPVLLVLVPPLGVVVGEVQAASPPISVAAVVAAIK
jgi:hypothetical protein